jgi:hypothetical protein
MYSSFVRFLKNKQKFSSAVLHHNNLNFAKNSFSLSTNIKAIMNTNIQNFMDPITVLTIKRMYSTNSKIFELYTNKSNKIPKKSKLTTSDNILDEKSLLPKHQPASVRE